MHLNCRFMIAALAASTVIPLAALTAQDSLAGAMRGPRFFLASVSTSRAIEGASAGERPIEPAAVPMMRRRVTVSLDHVPLRDAVEEIGRQAGLNLAYSASIVRLTVPVSIHAKDITVAAALTEVLIDQRLDVVITPTGQVILRPRRSEAVGSITGRVIDQITGAPVLAAEVTVFGTRLGSITDDSGRYTIVGVPSGTARLRATRIGYEPATQEVNVPEEGSVIADFALKAIPSQLSQVVVTATGEQQRKRELGNSVATLEPDVDQLAASTNMTDLLTARLPGIYVQQSGGTVGAGGKIRIRGSNSISLANDPLILVDGIRVDGDPGAFGFSGYRIGQAPSRLNDLNPDDIQSIEVLKGPAASALYGTAAANGVIAITTKRGHQGAAQWTVHAEGGVLNNMTTYPANYARVGLTPGGGRLTVCTLAFEAQGICTPVPDSLVSNNPLMGAGSPFITGAHRAGGASVEGGSQQMTYYLAGNYLQENGVFASNYLTQSSITANLGARPAANLHLSLNSNYVSSRLRLPENDDATNASILVNGLFGSAFDDPKSHGYLFGLPADTLQLVEDRQSIDRFTTSGTANWQMLSWLSGIATVGVDHVDQTDAQFVAPDVLNVPGYAQGVRRIIPRQIATYTANTALAGTYRLASHFDGKTTGGVQYTQTGTHAVNVYGQQLTPGIASINGAAASRITARELNDDNKTFGLYVQQQFSWNDRLFLTGALRRDDNSAFGKNLNAVIYPAASLSWVVSDEPFFPKAGGISSLRLRSAYGESGQRPTSLVNTTTFTAVTFNTGGGDASGLEIGALGNPDVKPERSREIEGGFDIGLFEDRLTGELTYYNKKTTDALVQRPLPPSAGVPTSRFENIGAVLNRGWEYELTARLIDRHSVSANLTFAGSTNDNRLLSLGAGIPPISLIGQSLDQWDRVGYPLGGYFDRQILYKDLNHDGRITNINCPGGPQMPGGPACELTFGDTVFLGGPLPKTEFSVVPTIDLFGRTLRITAVVDRKSGFSMLNATGAYKCLVLNCRAVYDPSASLFDQARALAAQQGVLTGYVEDASYTKLREVSATLFLPKRFAAHLRAQEASLTISGRNLHTWTNYTGPSPEGNSQPGANLASFQLANAAPVRYWLARLDVTF